MQALLQEATEALQQHQAEQWLERKSAQEAAEAHAEESQRFAQVSSCLHGNGNLTMISPVFLANPGAMMP